MATNVKIAAVYRLKCLEKSDAHGGAMGTACPKSYGVDDSRKCRSPVCFLTSIG